MASKSGQYWPPVDTSTYGYSGSNSSNSHQLPYDPNDPVLGTDMTQGEWDQLRALMRKAEEGGKMNELLTVHKKEVKNAPNEQTRSTWWWLARVWRRKSATSATCK